MAIISMRGLRRIFGKFSAAPPVLRPLTFFAPRKQTTLPAVNILHNCKCHNSHNFLSAAEYNVYHAITDILKRL